MKDVGVSGWLGDDVWLMNGGCICMPTLVMWLFAFVICPKDMGPLWYITLQVKKSVFLDIFDTWKHFAHLVPWPFYLSSSLLAPGPLHSSKGGGAPGVGPIYGTDGQVTSSKLGVVTWAPGLRSHQNWLYGKLRVELWWGGTIAKEVFSWPPTISIRAFQHLKLYKEKVKRVNPRCASNLPPPTFFW